jgi:hypothetical protein
VDSGLWRRRSAESRRGCDLLGRKQGARWYGSTGLGFGRDGRRLRQKVSGKTKTEVKDKLKELHSDLETGVQTSASGEWPWICPRPGRRLCRTLRAGALRPGGRRRAEATQRAWASSSRDCSSVR